MEDCNPTKKRKEANKKLSPIVDELFLISISIIMSIYLFSSTKNVHLAFMKNKIKV